MKLLFFCIILLIIHFKLRKIFKHTLAWGNYIDAAIHSCHNHKIIRNVKFLLNNKNLDDAEKKYKIKIHLPPQIRLINPLHKYECINHILLPDFLKQHEIKQYIWELQLKRTFYLQKDWTNYIIIHLRLSDVPFVRHTHYKLFTIRWYQNAIQLAHHFRKNCKVLLVCNLTHLNENLESARQILNVYAKHLKCDAEKLVNLRSGIIYLEPKCIAHEKVKSYYDINEIENLLLNYQE